MFVFQVFALVDGQLLTRAILAPDRRAAVAIAVDRVKASHPTGKVTRIVPVLDVSDYRKLAIIDTGLFSALETIDQVGFTTEFLFQHVARLIELTQQTIECVRELQTAKGERDE